MSRDFNGSTGKLDLPVSGTLRPSLPITFAAWVYPDSLKVAGIVQNNKTDANHRGAWMIMADTSGHIEAGYGNNVGSTSSQRRSKITSSTNALATGSWQHVAVCIRGATDMDIYLNGVDIGGSYSGSGGTMAYNTSVGGAIGCTAGTGFFDGKIAEAAIWNVSLSAAEVLAMAKGVPPLKIRPGSLLAHWPIYAVATTEADLSPNGLKTSAVSGTAPLADHAPVGSPY